MKAKREKEEEKEIEKREKDEGGRHKCGWAGTFNSKRMRGDVRRKSSAKRNNTLSSHKPNIMAENNCTYDESFGYFKPRQHSEARFFPLPLVDVPLNVGSYLQVLTVCRQRLVRPFSVRGKTRKRCVIPRRCTEEISRKVGV